MRQTRYAWLIALLCCCLAAPSVVVAGQTASARKEAKASAKRAASTRQEKVPQTRQTVPVAVMPPSGSGNFNEFDAAIRSNRDQFLRSGGAGSVAGGGERGSVVGIGNVIVNGGSTGPVVSQPEISNSTIIIQTK